MSKSSTLLKVISILYIIFGSITLLVVLFGLMFSSILSSIFAGFGALLALFIIMGSLGGILDFIAGIIGIRGRNLDTCKIFGILLVVLTVISLIVSVVTKRHIWYNLVNVTLAILYLVGVNQSIRVQ